MEWNEVSTMLWELLECLYKVLNIVGGSCLTLIGLYTFYRTFISKKIRFLGVGKSSDIWKGESCSVVIQNWSLSAISIEEVTLVVNDDYKVTVKKYLDHFLLEPLKAVKIESDRTSESPFYDQNFLDEKLELFVRCSDGKVLSAKFRKKKYKNPLRKYRYKKIVNYSIDGVLLPKDVKYAVNIIDADGKMIRNYINKYGIFKEPIAGYTAVEREIVDNIHEVARNLKGILGEQYSVQLEDISFSSTDDSTREIK